jgi:hypothetical protein
MRNCQKSLIGAGLGAVLGMAILSIPVTPTRAQPPSRVAVKETAATKGAASPTGDPGCGPQAGPFPDEVELLRLRVETERAQLGLAEWRLEQAQRWESRARELVDHGRLPIEQFIAAQDNAVVKQSDALAQRVAVKAAELRLAQAQRGIGFDRPLGSSSEGRLADLEQRLAAVERAVRSLRQETEHVKLDLPIEISSGR